jgi:PAS domain S-box-containing protein
MKIKARLPYGVVILTVLLLLTWLALHPSWIHDWHWENEAWHSAIEAAGALIAIIMGITLLQREEEEKDGKLFLLSLGFIGMGLLDIFHAVSTPGYGFVLLRSTAGLVGGLGFVLVWLPASYRLALGKKWLPWVVAAGSLSFGVWAILLRETLPKMVYDGQFTAAAVVVNVLAGVLFLAAAGRFLIDFYNSRRVDIFFLTILAFLFGLAQLMFRHSSLWDGEWWLWHFLRVVAYLLVLGFIVRRFSFAGLRVRLIFLVLMAIIPALGLIIYSAAEERRHAAEDVKLEALRLTQLSGSHTEDFIEGARHLLIALSYATIVRNRDETACNKRFAAMVKEYPFYTSIGAVDSAGNLFSNSLPFRKPINAAHRAWFRRVQQTRNFALGDFQYAGITGRPTLVLGYPVLDKRRAILAMVFVSVDLSWLNQKAKEANLPEGASLTMIDSRGTILARYPDPEKWVGKVLPEATLVNTILTQKEGLAETRGLDGIQRLYAFAPLHGAVETGLYLSIGISKEMAFKEIDRARARNLAVMVLVAVVALAAAWVGGDLFVLRKVKTLVEAARQLRNGDLNARTGLPYQNGEIAQLAHAFDEMAAALGKRALEAQQAEEELRESEKRYKKLTESVTDYIYTVKVERGQAVETSHGPGSLAVTGYTSEEYETDTSLWYRMIHEEDRAAVKEQAEKVLAGQPAPLLEHRIINKNGSILWVRNTLVFRYDEQGQLVAYDGLITDITERKRAEERLRETKDFLDKLIHYANTPIIIWDPQLKILRLNSAFERLTGYKAEEVIGKELDLLFPEANLDECLIKITATLMGEYWESVEIPILRKEGEIRLALWNSANIYADDGTTLLATIAQGQDITERKQAEEALAERERLLQMIFDAEPECVKLLAQDGTLLQINRAGLKMAEADSPEQVIGKSFYSVVVPEYQQAFRMLSESVFRGEPGTLEYELIGLKGTRRWQDAHAVPLRDQRGAIIALLSVTRDTTERKSLEAQLLQAQKLEAVGTLAGGVAHDFNNLLTAMMGNLELAKLKLERGQGAEEYLGEMENITQRAATLTGQLLAFSRRQIIQPVPLNLSDTITDMSKMLPRLIGEHITLELLLEGNLGMVKADPGQIEQVIMNLCVNARDAMPTGGKLILNTHNIHLEENYINNHPWVEKGDYVLLEVTDTGCGMDEATRQRIFEPFFTTKEVGKGTGLGLSMAYGIIKQHQGYIHVYSEPDRGTTFKIYLPRTEEKPAAAEVKAVFKAVGGQETILLAEDEDQLREAIKNILEMFGYTVLVAQDGQEAWELYQREKERIDLVILDAVMPRMGGKETADRIYEINPAQKILFSSGYSASSLHQTFIIPPQMHFIQKPYNAKTLAQKVREVLEA